VDENETRPICQATVAHKGTTIRTSLPCTGCASLTRRVLIVDAIVDAKEAKILLPFCVMHLNAFRESHQSTTIVEPKLGEERVSHAKFK
jgi:hypothetical protein